MPTPDKSQPVLAMCRPEHFAVQYEINPWMEGNSITCAPSTASAQSEYAHAIEGAGMILMLGTMLHAIGTGNMVAAGVRLICVNINPAVATKLADRGSIESTSIVTDVGLFLNLLAVRLCDAREEK